MLGYDVNLTTDVQLDGIFNFASALDNKSNDSPLSKNISFPCLKKNLFKYFGTSI